MTPTIKNPFTPRVYLAPLVMLWIISLVGYLLSGFNLWALWNYGHTLNALGYVVNTLSALYSVQGAIRGWHHYQDSKRRHAEFEAAIKQFAQLKTLMQRELEEQLKQ